jgi:dephospho-CoA kinase
MFDKLLVVYVSEEEQVNRLMERDGIDADRARGIVASQLSIEEKKSYGDFVIDNSGTLEATRGQVEELWEKLKELQRERSK